MLFKNVLPIYKYLSTQLDPDVKQWQDLNWATKQVSGYSIRVTAKDIGMPINYYAL